MCRRENGVEKKEKNSVLVEETGVSALAASPPWQICASEN